MARASSRTASETPLRRQLNSFGPIRPTPLDALRLARRQFQAGDRIDMQSLAAQLGVDRATLYRWVGSREHLLAEVLWSLMAETVHRLREPAGGGQHPAAAEVVSGAAEAAITNPGCRASSNEKATSRCGC